jgi:hypothetical protein
MDSSATDIQFDANGVCNYCRDYEARLQAARLGESDRTRRRESFLQKIRDDGRGKEYDCVVGVSGGVDSSYVLYLA